MDLVFSQEKVWQHLSLQHFWELTFRTSISDVFTCSFDWLPISFGMTFLRTDLYGFFGTPCNPPSSDMMSSEAFNQSVTISESSLPPSNLACESLQRMVVNWSASLSDTNITPTSESPRTPSSQASSGKQTWIIALPKKE